jgi:hypothetical protein
MNKYIVEYTSIIVDVDYLYPSIDDVIIEASSIEEAKIQFHKEFPKYKIDNVYLFTPCNM